MNKYQIFQEIITLDIFLFEKTLWIDSVYPTRYDNGISLYQDSFVLIWNFDMERFHYEAIFHSFYYFCWTPQGQRLMFLTYFEEERTGYNTTKPHARASMQNGPVHSGQIGWQNPFSNIETVLGFFNAFGYRKIIYSC